MEEFKQYLVVEFTENDCTEVSTIPKEWVKSKHECYWPAHLSAPRIQKGIRLGIEATDDWPVYMMNIMKQFDDYEKAMRFCQRALEESDPATTGAEDDVSNRKRSVRLPNRYREAYGEEDVEGFLKQPKKKFCGRPPVGSESSDEDIIGPALPATPKLPILQETGCRSKTTTPAARSITASPSTSKQGLGSQTYDCFVEIKHYLRENNRLLKQLLANSMTSAAAPSAPAEVPPEVADLLPFKTICEKKTLEKLLEDGQNSQALIHELGLLGGRNIKDCVGNIMSRVFSHNMAMCHNWQGHGGKKEGFESSPLVTIITTAVRKTQRGATKSEVEDTMKKWLRNARDRKGGRQARLKQGANGGQGVTREEEEEDAHS